MVRERCHYGRLGKIVFGVVVEPDDENAWVVASDSHDEVMERGKVFVIARQHCTVLGRGPGKDTGIVDGGQTDVSGEQDIVPRQLQPARQTATGEILVQQD